jgi:hypothetical protein
VAYRPISTQWLRNKQRQRPLRGNSFRNIQQYWSHCWASVHAQQWKYCWKQCFYVVHSEAITLDRVQFSSVQLVQCIAVQCSWVERVGWWVSELVRGLLLFSPCELMLLEAGSWCTGIVREPRIRGMSAVGSRYQKMTGEDTGDWEDFVRAVMNWRVWISDSDSV